MYEPLNPIFNNLPHSRGSIITDTCNTENQVNHELLEVDNLVQVSKTQVSKTKCQDEKLLCPVIENKCLKTQSMQKPSIQITRDDCIAKSLELRTREADYKDRVLDSQIQSSKDSNACFMVFILILACAILFAIFKDYIWAQILFGILLALLAIIALYFIFRAIFSPSVFDTGPIVISCKTLPTC